MKFDPNTSATYCVGNGSESTCPGAGSPCYGGPGNDVEKCATQFEHPQSENDAFGKAKVLETFRHRRWFNEFHDRAEEQHQDRESAHDVTCPERLF